MKLELSIRYNIEMLGKKSEPPAGIKPTMPQMQMPVGCSNH